MMKGMLIKRHFGKAHRKMTKRSKLISFRPALRIYGRNYKYGPTITPAKHRL